MEERPLVVHLEDSSDEEDDDTTTLSSDEGVDDILSYSAAAAAVEWAIDEVPEEDSALGLSSTISDQSSECIIGGDPMVTTCPTTTVPTDANTFNETSFAIQEIHDGTPMKPCEEATSSSPWLFPSTAPNPMFVHSPHRVMDVCMRLSLYCDDALPYPYPMPESASTPLPTPSTSFNSTPARKGGKKKSVSKLLSPLAVKIMSCWYERNLVHPYPTPETCESLAQSGGITVEQVQKWFANKRLRSKNTKSKRDVAQLRKHLRQKFHQVPN
jgi:hypothetical protein